jgi:hypothetical protein
MIGNIARVRGSVCTTIFTEKFRQGYKLHGYRKKPCVSSGDQKATPMRVRDSVSDVTIAVWGRLPVWRPDE